MKKYKVSKFARIYRKGNDHLLFSADNLEIYHIDKEAADVLGYLRTPHSKEEVFCFFGTMGKKEEFSRIWRTLINDRFIVCESTQEDAILLSDTRRQVAVARKNLGKGSRLNALRVVMTEKCNLGCDYCFVNGKTGGRTIKDMEWPTLKQGIDLIADLNKNREIEIQFFGGEPLIKFKMIKQAVEYANKLMKTRKIEKVLYGITTNGTLVTDEEAEFFKKNNFLVSVSVDGWEDLHDLHRKFKSGGGSFKQVREGLGILKKHSCTIGALYTPSAENIGRLAEACEYMIKDLGMNYITINTPQPISGNWEVPGKEFSRELKKCFSIAKKHHATINHFGTRVLFSLNNKSKMILGCSKYSDHYTATLTPAGMLSPCIVSWEHAEVLSPAKGFSYAGKFSDWKLTEPYFFKKCLDCEAMNVCGGPCPLEIYEMKKLDKPIDHERCNFFKDFVKWAVWYSE